jgi:rubredoxin
MDIKDLFKCDCCGSHQLEEIMDNTHVRSQILSVDKETGEIEYGEVENTDGEVVRYQCTNCGHVVAESQEALCVALGVGPLCQED